MPTVIVLSMDGTLMYIPTKPPKQGSPDGVSTGVGPTQAIDIASNIGRSDNLSGLRTPFSISKSRSKDGTNAPVHND